MIFTMLASPKNIIAAVVSSIAPTSPKRIVEELKVDDFEVVKTEAEVREEQKVALIQKADAVFTGAVQKKVTYSYEQLSRCGRTDRESGDLIPFRQYREPGSYTRRYSAMHPIFNAASEYHRDMSENIIDEQVGKGPAYPMRHLQQQVIEKDEAALRVAAMLFQLGDDATQELHQLGEEALVVPCEDGTIDLQGSRGFTIRNDHVAVADKEGEVLALYKSYRAVQIEGPNADGTVSCDITQTFQKIYPTSEG
jgi:hypothetical protein